MSYVEFKNVSKIYEVADNKIYANNNINLNINKNEFCVIEIGRASCRERV